MRKQFDCYYKKETRNPESCQLKPGAETLMYDRPRTNGQIVWRR